MLKVHMLREMTRMELSQKRAELEDELFNLNMRRSLKALDNPLRLRQIRREVARIDTILNEDRLGIAKLAETSASILGEKKESGKEKGE